MGEFAGLLVALFIIGIIIVVMRLFGAWMLRIDEVIKLQKQMLTEIKKLTNKEL